MLYSHPEMDTHNSTSVTNLSPLTREAALHLSTSVDRHYTLTTLHRSHYPAWSSEWLAQAAIHNVGNAIAALFAITSEIQGNLCSKQTLHLHSAFAYLQQTLRVSQQLLKQPRIHCTTIDLGAIIRNTLSILEAECKQKCITLQNTVPKHLPALAIANRSITEQIFFNLFRNSIEVLEKSKTPHKKRITVSIHIHEKSIEVVITDTGPGVPPQVVSLLGSPGFSSKKTGGGLGLTFVRWHMKHTFRGAIRFQSVPGGRD